MNHRKQREILWLTISASTIIFARLAAAILQNVLDMADKATGEKSVETTAVPNYQCRMQPVNLQWPRERKMRIIRQYFESRKRDFDKSDRSTLERDRSIRSKKINFFIQLLPYRFC